MSERAQAESTALANRLHARLSLTTSLALLVLSALNPLPSPAHAQTAPTQADLQARFDAATEAMASGQYQRAVASLLAIADDAPASALAADALFTAAKLCEDRLADPARARALYQRLVSAYPSSRTALAAQRRATDLAETIGPSQRGAPALAAFTDILQHFTERGERQSLTMAEAVLTEYPDWSGRARVLAWMGDVHQRMGRHEQALARYLESNRAATALATQAGREEALVESFRGAGEAALALSRFDAAERYFRQMPINDDPSRARSLEDALERVERLRLRALLYQLSFALLALVLALLLALLRTAAGSNRVMLTAARALPGEVVFMIPIAGILMAASLTAHYAIAPAVTIICLGGVGITWLSGVGLRAARVRPGGLGGWRPPVHALASICAIVALTYIALHHNRLVDMIVETVRFGPDL